MSFAARDLQECCERLPSLSRDGFTALNAFLCSKEIEEIKRFVETAVRLPQDSTCRRPHNTLIPLRWNDSIVQCVLLSEFRLRQLRDVTQGANFKRISGYISSKEAFSPALWWHQDWWCWNHPVSYRRQAAQIALLCYLTDTTIENGALRVLPGSHLESAPIHSILPEAHSQSAETIQSERAALGDLTGQITLDLKGGRWRRPRRPPSAWDSRQFHTVPTRLHPPLIHASVVPVAAGDSGPPH